MADEKSSEWPFTDRSGNEWKTKQAGPEQVRLYRKGVRTFIAVRYPGGQIHIPGACPEDVLQWFVNELKRAGVYKGAIESGLSVGGIDGHGEVELKLTADGANSSLWVGHGFWVELDLHVRRLFGKAVKRSRKR